MSQSFIKLKIETLCKYTKSFKRKKKKKFITSQIQKHTQSFHM